MSTIKKNSTAPKSYTYKERSKTKNTITKVASLAIIGGVTYVTAKGVLGLLGIKALGTLGTLALAGASGYVAHKATKRFMNEIEGKTFYFESDRVIIVKENGDIDIKFYKDIPQDIINKFNGAETLDQKSLIIDTTPNHNVLLEVK